MKLNLLPLFLLLALLVGSGCSSVQTTHPLSSDPKPIDKEKFEGAWLFEEGIINVKFAEDGVAKFVALKWKNDTFLLIQAEAIVAEGENSNYISFRILEGDGKSELYFFSQYQFTDDGDLIMWFPNISEFEKMVESKRLQGVVDKSEYSTDIHIKNEPESLLKIIDDPDNMKLFEYRNPMILKKIAPVNY